MSRKRRPLGGDQAIVAQFVADLRDEFPYPDTSRRRISNPQPERGGGGGAPTVVVAAADATEFSKARADFICEGGVGNNVDHITIQAAVDVLPAAIGGRILLTEGAYFCEFGQLAWSTSRVSVQGLGRNTPAVNFFGGSGDAISLAAGAQYNTIRDLALFGPDTGTEIGLDVAGQLFTLQNCLIQSFGGAGVRVANSAWILDNHISGALGVDLEATTANVRIEGNHIEAEAQAIVGISRPTQIWITNNYLLSNSVTVDAVSLDVPVDTWITDNFITGGRNGIRIADSGFQSIPPHNISITGNTVEASDEEGIYVDGNRGISFLRIGNNFVQSTGVGLGAYQDTGAITVIGDSTDSPDITVNDKQPPVKIWENTIEAASLLDGIRVQYAHLADISHNYVEAVGGHGYAVIDSSGVEVDSNKAVWPSTDNARDAFYLDGDSDRNYFHGNAPVNDVPNGQWRYGINIAAATCDCTVVVGNLLGPTADYGTDQLNDNGSATQLFYPADATYGDNFIGCWGS